MKRTVKIVGLVGFLASTFFALGADAAQDGVAHGRENGAEWFGEVGAVGDLGGRSDRLAGLASGVTVLGRRDSIAFGGEVEAAGGSATRLTLAGTAGWSYRGDSGFGFDLLARAGVHRYDGVGQGWVLSSDPGISGSLPFAGLRARGVYVFGKGPTHFQLGLGLAVDHDFGRTTQTYSYQETGWLNGGTFTETATHTIGFTTMTGTLDLGMTFDTL